MWVPPSLLCLRRLSSFLCMWLNKHVCAFDIRCLVFVFIKSVSAFEGFSGVYDATCIQLWSILLRPAQSMQHIRRHAKWKYARARRGKNCNTSRGMMTVSLHGEVLEASPELQQGNTLKSAAVSCLYRLESVNWSPSLRKVQVSSQYYLQLYYQLPQTSRSYPGCSFYF